MQKGRRNLRFKIEVFICVPVPVNVDILQNYFCFRLENMDLFYLLLKFSGEL